MGLQILEIRIKSRSTRTSFNRTFKLSTARLPMLFSHFVLEMIGALITCELRIVQLLHDKAIHVLAEVELVAAVRAGVVPLLPLGDASRADKLIALIALFGLLDNLKADRAAEILV